MWEDKKLWFGFVVFLLSPILMTSSLSGVERKDLSEQKLSAFWTIGVLVWIGVVLKSSVLFWGFTKRNKCVSTLLFMFLACQYIGIKIANVIINLDFDHTFYYICFLYEGLTSVVSFIVLFKYGCHPVDPVDVEGYHSADE